MKKIKTFWYVLKNSVISPKYYNDIVKASLKFSIKYFLMLSVFASIIYSLYASIEIVPQITSTIEAMTIQIKENFPDDLIINFKDGSWEANKPEPIIIPAPSIPNEENKYLPDNLIVFDKNGTIDSLGSYNTYILVNGENILYGSGGYETDPQKVSIQPLKNIPNITLDKNTVNSRLESMNKLIKTSPYVMPIFIFLYTFILNYIGGALFYALLIALLLQLIAFFAKRKLDYKKACQISIHAMTAPIILQLAASFFPQASMYTIIWFIILSIALSIYFMFKMEDKDLKKIEKV